MDLNVSIVILDELGESVVKSTGMLSLASGEIRSVEYDDHDIGQLGLPAEDANYEFTSGVLSHAGKDVEFRVEVDVLSGKYSVTADELLELKGRAARLFSEAPRGTAPAAAAPVAAPAATSSPLRRRRY